MCSIIINRINKNLTNVVREYLLPKKEYNKIVEKNTYFSNEKTNIKSQYLYLRLKREYFVENILVYKSNYYENTIAVSILHKNLIVYINIRDFPYQDIHKIKDKTLKKELYNKKLRTNENSLHYRKN